MRLLIFSFSPQMKIVLAVLCVALAGLAIWQYKTITTLNDRVSLLTLQLNSYMPTPTPPPAAPKPIASVPRVICPACRGEMTLVYDPSGSNNPLNRKTQTCPVCLGRGYRTLNVPDGMELCPDCKGMGLVYSEIDGYHPISAGNCARCGATGLVRSIK